MLKKKATMASQSPEPAAFDSEAKGMSAICLFSFCFEYIRVCLTPFPAPIMLEDAAGGPHRGALSRGARIFKKRGQKVKSVESQAVGGEEPMIYDS